MRIGETHSQRKSSSAGENSMNVQPQFGSDEERAARRLIEQAGTILKGLRGGISESFVNVLFAGAARGQRERPGRILKARRGGISESFVTVLFAGATPEDLVRYEPRELADLA